jgi:carbon monoxide dehydrogenase subunit G
VARITETLHVPAAVDDAFDLVADFTSTERWDPGIRSARRLDDGPIGLGSRFEVQLALGPLSAPLVYEITAYERPGRVVLTTRGKLHRGEDDVRFRATDAGTEVLWNAEFAVRGPVGTLVDPFLGVGFRRAAGGAVDGLADALGGRLRLDA